MIPHDIWRPLDLPNVSKAGQVGLLLFGFDRWFALSSDGSEIEIVDYVPLKTGNLEYGIAKDIRSHSTRIRKQNPNTIISISGNKISATGPPMELLNIKKAIVRLQQPITVDKQTVVFTMSANGTRHQILRKIATQLNLKYQFDPSLDEVLKKQVSVKVHLVQVDELLLEVIRGLNAIHSIESGKLVIRKK